LQTCFAAQRSHGFGVFFSHGARDFLGRTIKQFLYFVRVGIKGFSEGLSSGNLRRFVRYGGQFYRIAGVLIGHGFHLLMT
jgi:hypothetical protein